MPETCKKLIEVAMPVKEISAESVRDKSIRHGHISTLHLWWARRPLPVCRAVVFASVVPDPLDENCPKAFKEAIELLLGKDKNPGDPYKPYEDIPYTSVKDPMENNLRNRLLMFIGKFSDKYIENEKKGKKTDAKELLSNDSLIKWESKNNEKIIGKARKLIWVANNARNGKSIDKLFNEFDTYSKAIKDAEKDLYNTPNRHIKSDDIKSKERKLQNAIDSFLDKMPKVFDPFAGGGAIPLEAARLGCKTYANDLNPVAHIIQKGSIEFPQKYGKPIIYSKGEFINQYGEEEFNKLPKEDLIYQNGNVSAVIIENRLVFDIEYYSMKLLKMAEAEIGHLYPADKKGNKPIIYYWARIGICSNPTCKAEVPLLRNFYLCNKIDKTVYLNPIIKNKEINFSIENGISISEPFCKRGNMVCPICGNATDISYFKQQSIADRLPSRLIAVIEDSQETKKYRLPNPSEIEVLNELPDYIEVPNEMMQRNSGGGDTFGWGITKWGQLYTKRQLFAMHSFVKNLCLIEKETDAPNNEYFKTVSTYLALFVDRMATRLTSFGLWNTKAETLEHPFARQAIPMVLDYPETNPFSTSTGGAYNQLDWIIRYIETESPNSFFSICRNTSSGDVNQFNKKSIDVSVTDPPYYDAIAYADISDYFYIWMKRTLLNLYPYNFATPQTPKTEECTALKHHHGGNINKAKRHFENKLAQIFSAIEMQTNDLISIMFAHQSTEAWSTLCNSILGARMNITGSWAIDTERTSGVKVDKAFLSSSVTVSCRPTMRKDTNTFKNIKKAIEERVSREVTELYALGFRGPDLLTACFGQAVSEFGKYEKVEKADGSEVKVTELLELARDAAFDALVRGFEADDFTKFYIGWLQLFGFTESEFDDVNRLVKVGLAIETRDLFDEHLLIKNGNRQTLANYSERISVNRHLGEDVRSNLVDKVHRGMYLFKNGNRSALLNYLSKVASSADNTFWRLLNSLTEVLSQVSEDYKQAKGLLDNKDNLLREAKQVKPTQIEEDELGFKT